MLKDVIDFVRARTGLVRSDALREINYAWNEIYNSDDLPNSLQEISIAPIDNTARISLPWFVGFIRGVKINQGRLRIDLNTPRPYYQDDHYTQSPYIWRVLGTSPLSTAITNATTVKLTFRQPVTEQVIVTLMGPDDRGADAREQITFNVGDTEKTSTKRFIDFTQIAKNIITDTDLEVLTQNDAVISIVPNSGFAAKNTIVQITDKCYKLCTFCRCFDVLFKRTTPYLYYDEAPVPFEEVLMAKTLEWISLPKDGQEKKAELFGLKAVSLLSGYNANERSETKMLDLGRNKFTTNYVGTL